MIYSRLRTLRHNKEEAENRKLTYDVLTAETGLSPSTLARLFDRKPVDRIDGKTLTTLCQYFGVSVGDVLEFVPESEAEVPGRARELVAA